MSLHSHIEIDLSDKKSAIMGYFSGAMETIYPIALR